MRDLNDPQLLGEHIIQLCSNGMKPCQAADYLYQDMSEHGWHYGYLSAPASDPLRLYVAAQERRRAAGLMDGSPPSENGTQGVQ